MLTQLRTALLLLLIATLAAGCAEHKIANVANLAATDVFTQPMIDSVAAHLALVPNGVQVAIGIVVADSSYFTGIQCRHDTLRYLENRDSLFEIGSISKVFTATILTRLVAQGQLRLDDSLGSLPGFSHSGDASPIGRITLLNLANHTSGLPSVPGDFMWHARLHFQTDDPYWDFDRSRLEAYLQRDIRLDFAPGERYQYSNLGYAVLGYALERKSGQSYDRLLAEQILHPLMMTSTCSRVTPESGRLVRGIDVHGRLQPNWDLHAFTPAGGLKSTTRDLVQFVRAQWGEGDSAYSASQRLTYRINNANAVAVGWHIRNRDDGRVWWLHPGGTRGYTGLIIADPAARRGVIVLSNLSSLDSISVHIEYLCLGIMGVLR